MSHFYCFIKDFLNESFFSLHVYSCQNTVTASTVWCYCLDLYYQQFYPNLASITPSAQWKWHMMSSCKNSLSPMETPWSVDHIYRNSALVWSKREGWGNSIQWIFHSFITENSAVKVVDICLSFSLFSTHVRSAIKRRTLLG